MKAMIAAIAVLFFGIGHADENEILAAHPASQMIKATLTEAKQIMKAKPSDDRNAKMCAVFKRSADYNSIGYGLLGDYANIRTDKAGVAEFIKTMPSVGVSRLMESFDKIKGDIAVDNKAYDAGNGRLQVHVVANSDGNSYEADVIVVKAGAVYVMQDINYLGFSAVGYFSRDVQNELYNEYQTNPKKPVTAYVQKLKSQPGYIDCH